MSGSNLPPIAETPYLPKKRKRSSDATEENISVGNRSSVIRPEYQLGAVTPPETRQQPLRKSKRSSTASNEEALRVNSHEDEDQEFSTESANDPEGLEPRIGSAANHDEEATAQETKDDSDSVELAAELLPGNTQDSSASSVEGQQIEDRRHSDASNAKSEEASGSVNSADASVDDGDLEGDDEEGSVDSQDGEMSASGGIVSAALEVAPADSMQASPAASPPESNADQESPVKQVITSAPDGTTVMVTNKPMKKLPGRRRAPHPNPKVEAALRRQLHLRMNYRAVAKTLKPLLAELAKRSLSEIEDDTEAYQKTTEYPVVKEGLHQYFEQRLARVQKHKELSKKRLADMLAEQTEMRNQQHVVGYTMSRRTRLI